MTGSHPAQSDGPRFEHDCDKCTFLGRMDDVDAYGCMQGGELPTVVLRWGDKPEEYRSAVEMFEKLTPELKRKAREWLVADPDVKLILDILDDAGGELHIEHLEHRYYERGGS